MIYLAGALVLLNVVWIFVLDRKDKRHDAQMGRLLVHIQAPQQAVMQQMPQLPEPEYRFQNEFTEQQEHLQDLVPFMEPD